MSKPTLLRSALLAALVLAPGAMADTLPRAAPCRVCPADLSALDTQVQTPGLRARLTMPLDPIIEAAGGLETALTRSQAALSEVQARRARALAEGRDTQSLDEAVLIFTKQIEAIECRQAGG